MGGPGAHTRESISRGRLAPIEQLHRLVLEKGADSAIMNLEGQDAARFQAQGTAQSGGGLHSAGFGRAGRYNQHDLTTAYGQSEAFLVAGITFAALAQKGSLDVDAPHSGSHPPGRQYRRILTPLPGPPVYPAGSPGGESGVRVSGGRSSRAAGWH